MTSPHVAANLPVATNTTQTRQKQPSASAHAGQSSGRGGQPATDPGSNVPPKNEISVKYNQWDYGDVFRASGGAVSIWHNHNTVDTNPTRVR